MTDHSARQNLEAMRSDLDLLEGIKNEAVEFWERVGDPSDRDLWIGDVKEAFYATYAAWETLRSFERSSFDADDVLRFGRQAQSRCAQAASKLDAENPEGAALARALERSVSACLEAIRAQLELVAPEATPTPPIRRVLEGDNQKFELPCSVCGATAMSIFVERVDDVPRLKINGITTGYTRPAHRAPDVFGLLQGDDLLELHRMFSSGLSIEDGIDAYCPDCDKIYCRKHYNAVEEFDEGFYDYTTGTCPAGHSRIIDD